MGNIIGYMVDVKYNKDKSDDSSNKNGTRPIDPNEGTEGEFKDREQEKKEKEDQEKKDKDMAEQEGYQENNEPPQPVAPPFNKYDVEKIKDKLSNLDENLNSLITDQTSVDFIKDIENNINTAFDNVVKNSYNLMLDQPFISENLRKLINDSNYSDFSKISVQFINEANDNEVYVDDVIKTIAENFQVLIDSCKDQLASLQSKITSLNQFWNDSYGENNQLIAEIDSIRDETDEKYLSNYSFTDYEEWISKIDAILQESDTETEQLNSIVIETDNVTEALSILFNSFANIYDIYDDESELKKYFDETLPQFKTNLQSHIEIMKKIEENQNDIEDKIEIISNNTTTIANDEIIFNEDMVNLKSDFNSTSGFEDDYKEMQKIIDEKYIENIDSNQFKALKTSFDAYVASYNEIIKITFDSIFQSYLDDVARASELLNDLITNVANSLSDEWIAKYDEVDFDNLQAKFDNSILAWNNYISARDKVNSNFQDFGNRFGEMTGNFEDYYNTVLTNQNNEIERWMSGVQNYEDTITNCYVEIQNAKQSEELKYTSDIETPTIKTKMKALDDNYALLYSIYQDTFKSETSFYTQFMQQKKLYDIAVSVSSKLYLYIDDIIIAYNQLKVYMDDISTNAQTATDLKDSCLTLISDLKKLISQSKSDKKLRDDETAYSNKLAALNPKISDKTTDLNNNKKAMEKYKSTLEDYKAEIAKYFGDDYDDLKTTLSSDNYYGDVNVSTILDNLKKIDISRSSWLTDVDVMIGNLNSDISAIQGYINQINDYNQGTKKPNVYERTNLDAFESYIDGLQYNKSDSYSNSIKDLGDEYEEIIDTVIAAYDLASIIDSKFQKYAKNIVETYESTIEFYKKLLDQEDEESWRIYNSISQNGAIVECRYINLYNAITWYELYRNDETKKMPNSVKLTSYNENGELVTKTTNCDDLGATSSSIDQLYIDYVTRWEDLKNYLHSDSIDEYNGIIKKIDDKMDKLSTDVNSLKQFITDYNTKTVKNLKTIRSNFDTEYNNFMKYVNEGKNEDMILSTAKKTYDIVISTYNSYQVINLTNVESEFEAMKSLSGSDYDAIYILINEDLSAFIQDTTEYVRKKKRDIIRFTNAAKILSYLFGHYYVGRINYDKYDPTTKKQFVYVAGKKNEMKEWKSWLQYEISSCLIPDEYIDYETGFDYRLDVFNTLCLYAPILPLIWPYGDSDIEKTIQTADNSISNITGEIDSSSFNNEQYKNMLTYISTKLVDYIYNAIINTMDNPSLSPLEQYVEDNAYYNTVLEMQKSDETTSDINKLITSYLEIKDKYDNLMEKYNEIMSQIEAKNKILFANVAFSKYDIQLIDDVYYIILTSVDDDGKTTKETLEFANQADAKLAYESNQIYLQTLGEINELNTEKDKISDQMTNYKTEMDSKYKEITKSSELVSYKDSYWEMFIKNDMSEVIDIDDKDEKEKLFLEKCRERIDVAYQGDNLHLYWKLLRTLSMKFDNSENKFGTDTKVLPNNFPKTNMDAELKEAVIITLNRIFSYYGSICDERGKPVSWGVWETNDIDSVIIPGGQCIIYSDTNYYNVRMYGNNYATVPVMFDKSQHVSMDQTLLNDNSSSNYKLTGIDKFALVDKSSISGDPNYYVKFRNPTKLLDFIFMGGMTNLKSISTISIDNFTKRSSEIPAVEVDNYVDKLVGIIKSYGVTNSMKLSTDYLRDSNITDKIFSEVMLFVYSWSLNFPVIPIEKPNTENKDEVTGDYYPISKINSVLYHTKIVENNIVRNYGNTIYQIFNDIAPINETDIVNGVNLPKYQKEGKELIKYE